MCHTPRICFVGVFLLACIFPGYGETPPADLLDSYNVVWRIPGPWYLPPMQEKQGVEGDASMPIGNGDIGCNVWVEPNGDLVFTIGKTDSWSENGRLLKLGRVRVSLSPNPFQHGHDFNFRPFRQELKLRQGEIEITAGGPGAEVQLSLWVDANHPVIRLEAKGEKDFEMQVQFETWRETGYVLKETSYSDIYDRRDEKNPYATVVYPDVIVPGMRDRIVWYHHNAKSGWPVTMRVQGLKDFMEKATDPLLARTFGASVQGKGFTSVSDRGLRSSEARREHRLSIYALTRHPSTVDSWMKELDETIARVEQMELEKARTAHRRWWNEFWTRSWIRINGDEDGIAVSKAYTLFRYLLACGGRGAQPIKFNGSIFTWEHEGDPDYRQWGPGYWWQNQRLIYWPMIASGDFDLMGPFLKMYQDILPLGKERTSVYFGHKGVHFPETMYFWGTHTNQDYGWSREGKPVSQVDNNYIRHLWQGGLELLAIMLDYHAYTGDERFLKEKLLPMAEEILTFYDLHYKRDKNGKLHIWPAQSLETWWESTNPMPEVAGLKFVLGKLLALPEQNVGEELRDQWKRLISEVPPTPTRRVEGQTILSPAEKFARKGNIENPELYAVFPFRLYGVGKPELERARETFRKRLHIEGNHGHDQDDLHAAYLGLASRARDFVTTRMGPKYLVARFPVFWHGGYDWPPDQVHGGNGMATLQTMLMQAEDEKILLFPAWPKEWDVEFKLHAPRNTTVEGVYRNGKLEQLKVTPESRAKDVVKLEPQPYVPSQRATPEPAEKPTTQQSTGNRLTHLDLESDPFYPSLSFPKLTVPQWVGERGVEAVVVLSIDDMGISKMKRAAHYESYLRPILDRLKEIDGRAPVSIMVNSLDADEPELKTFLQEGVNLAIHSFGHVCPLLEGKGVADALARYNGSLDQVSEVPGTSPTAFRLPCLRTPTPRFYEEVFNRTSPAGRFLTIDSSVVVLLSPQDPDLPRSLVIDPDGGSKFEKYLLGDFAIQNYPYPYVIGSQSWQFPVILPNDFAAHKANRHYYDSITKRDLKAAIDAVLIKQGIFTMLFHPHERPHGWIRNQQIVKLIDYADRKHGRKIKFLTFREAQERLDKNLLGGQPLRAANGQDNGVRLLDLNNDGLLDVVIGNQQVRQTRLWRPRRRRWVTGSFPVALVGINSEGNRLDAGARFGVLRSDGQASLLVRNETEAGLWHFNGGRWTEEPTGLVGLELDGQPVFTGREGRDMGVRLRDLDGDGRCELLVSNPRQQAIFGWLQEEKQWRQLPFTLPEETLVADVQGRDAGLRFVDLNEDGSDDLVFSNDERYSVHVFESIEKGWRQVRSGTQGEPHAVPPIVRAGTNNGAWFQSRHMWWANEGTADSEVVRRSFEELLSVAQ